MAGAQLNNIQILDLTTGLTRTLETGGTPDILQIETDLQLLTGANLLVDGDLVVNGTTTTVHSEQVNLRDNHLYLNADYTTAVAQTGGFVVNVLPTATTDTVDAGGFTAGVPAVSNPTVITAGAGTFSAGDIVQISGADNQSNDGLFEVESHVGTALTIRGVGTTATTQDWFTNQFETDSTVAGQITLVNVNVLRGTSTGDWETFTGNSTTGLTYNTFTTQGTVDLQAAYEEGNQITTDAGNGSVVIAGTELLQVTAAGGIDLNTVFDFDGTSFDVQMTGGNGFSIDGAASSNVTVDNNQLLLNTTTAGNVAISAASDVDIDAASNITLDAGAFVSLDAVDSSNFTVAGNAAGAVNLDLAVTNAGAGTGNVLVSADDEIDMTTGGVIDLNASSGMDFSGGTGSFDFDSTIAETVALMSLTTAGAGGDSVGFFVGTSDPSGAVTADAGSLFFRDEGTTGELYLNTSTGSGTTWEPVVTGTSLDLQTAYENGNTIVTDATNGPFDVSGTEAISLDAFGSASNFTVDSATLTLQTTTSGSIGIAAADNVVLNAQDFTATVLSSIALSAADPSSFTVSGNSAGATDLVFSTSNAGAGTASLLMDADDGVEINSTGGALNIGNDADAQAINIGTGAAARTITMGNASGVTAVNLDAGTGAFSLDSTVGGSAALMTLTTSGADGDSVEVFVSDLDPSAAAGIPAPVGSTLHRDAGGTGTAGEMWLKTGAADTAWEQFATGSTAESLQDAYEVGNTIVTDATNGDFDVSGTEAISLDAQSTSNFTVSGSAAGATDLTLSASNAGAGTASVLVTADDEIDITSASLIDINAGSDLDIDVSGNVTFDSAGSFSADAVGASNVTTDSGSLTLSTTTTGIVNVDGVGGVEINSTGGFLGLGNDADAQDILIGTGAAARTITVGNSTGATALEFNAGTGAHVFSSTVPETSALVTLTATGAGGDSVGLFVGDNDPSGTVSADAGSLFFRDEGTTGELYLNTSTGSGTVWSQIATGGSVDLQEAYEAGNTIVTDTTNGDFDVSGTEAISLDAGAASNFTVDGANLTLSTTTSGTLDFASAADIQMTFATNNAAAMVIDDGTNNFMTFDSTTGDLAVEVNQFLDITGSGSGITLTANATIAAGDVITIEGTSGDAILADSNTGTTIDGLAIGIAATAATASNPVKVYTVPGSLVPVNFAAAPAAAQNGRPVYVSQTPGEGTLTAPTGSGNVVYVIGILQGADGVTTSPNVVYQPQFISLRP